MKRHRLEVLAATYAISAGCSGAQVASGGIDIIHIDQPDWYIWYQAALVATVLYCPVAPLLTGRAADTRVVAALPLITGTVLTSFTLLKGLEALSEISPHFGRGVVAAVLAESLFPWSIAGAVSAVTSLAIGVTVRKRGTLLRSTRSGSIAIALSAGATVSVAGLMLYVWSTVGRTASLSALAASILFFISVVALSAAAASAFWLQRGMARPASPRWLWLFAVFSSAAGGLGFLVTRKLGAVAAAGG